MKFKYVIACAGLSLVLSSCGETPAPVLDSISLSGSYQTEYVVGEAYNSTGLVVTATYSDQSTKQVADYTVSGFDSSSVGEKTVTITYQQKTASYTVNVSPIDPTHLDITLNVTVKGIETYAKNHSHIYIYQKFASKEWSFTPLKNTSGNLWTVQFLQVQVGKTYEYNLYYGDENLPDVDNGKNVINGSSSSLAVTKDTTTYALEATFNVVEPKAVTLNSISLEGGYKTVYKVNETLDLTGLVVVAHYSDDSTKTIKNYTSSGFDSTKKGSCEVIISYTEGEITKTAGFTATITNPLKNIAIKTKPTKTVYEYGEEFSKTGLQVTATYEDNSTKDVENFEVSGYDKTVIGEQTITVTYVEDNISKSATFTIKVNNSVKSISVTHLPDKTEYLPGEAFKADGLIVSATLKDGTKVLLDSEDYTLSGFESSSAGQKIITVKYKDNSEITANFTVTVNKPDVSNVASIQVTTKPTKLTYFLGEEFDLTGMVVTATYINEEKEAVLGYEVEGFDSSTPGEKTITITYGVGVDTFKITVAKSYQNITLNITVSGLSEYKDSYSKIYINHNFGLEDPQGEWVTQVMTQDQNNKDMWSISLENIETERYYNYNCYFGDDTSADMTYGKNIIDDQSQSLQVVRGTTTYEGSATFQISHTQKEFDLVIKPTVKTSVSAAEEELGDEVYVWAWDSQSDTTNLFTKKQDGYFHKQFTVDLVNGKGSLTFNAVLSNYWGEAPNPWVYQMGVYDQGGDWENYDSGYTLNVTTTTTATVEYDALFNGQPTFNTYDLKLNVSVSGEYNTISTLQFVYNFTNNHASGADYVWNDDFKYSEGLATYSLTIAGLPLDKPTYFKIYIYKTDTTEQYIGAADSANFMLAPQAISTLTADVSITVGNNVGTCSVSGKPDTIISFGNQQTTVYGDPIAITPTFTDANQHTFTVDYQGTNIRVDEIGGVKKIVGLKAGTMTEVKLTADTGSVCYFWVEVKPSNYEATWTRDWVWVNYNETEGNDGKACDYEGWFEEHNVDEIANMDADFMNGIDISSCKALYDNGTKFYNTDGVEQSLFYILKENGVNWIRMKLWVDPKDSAGHSYGGGVNDLATDLWIAKEAKAAGLKVLLDFHYSDFWTDPTDQIIPKAWKNASSVQELAGLVQSYTTDTLNEFKNAGCLPEMVQLGNEISSGMFKQLPGEGTTFTKGEPIYSTGKSSSGDLAAGGGNTASENMKTYLTAAANGVNAVDSDIEKIVHWAKGGAGISANLINSFFNSLDGSVDYDYAAFSFYPFYCFNTMSEAQTILNGLSLSKPWFIAETSYPFSGLGYVYEDVSVTEFTISKWYDFNDSHTWKWGGSTTIHTEYEYDAEGQANIIHDLTNSVVSAGGKGIFYWEGAWVPNVNVGWAGSGSTCTWSNQGFFSYNGKAIANINIFKQMSPHI